MISDIVLMILLVKNEQININGLYIMTIIFHHVCINPKMLWVLTCSKGICHEGGGDEESGEMLPFALNS